MKRSISSRTEWHSEPALCVRLEQHACPVAGTTDATPAMLQRRRRLASLCGGQYTHGTLTIVRPSFHSSSILMFDTLPYIEASLELLESRSWPQAAHGHSAWSPCQYSQIAHMTGSVRHAAANRMRSVIWCGRALSIDPPPPQPPPQPPPLLRQQQQQQQQPSVMCVDACPGARA